MDFTREPIIETVITPKEGCKLVVRSSKSVSQEEYFVDAVEVITFGQAIFFRCLEKPKAFIVPASDYEVLEVREARIVLKNVGLDRSIKIGGGREAHVKPPKEEPEEKINEQLDTQKVSADALNRPDPRLERKKDRRRQSRRKRGRDEGVNGENADSYKLENEEKIDLVPPEKIENNNELSEVVASTGSLMSHLLSPPPLISETIARYKEKFKDAFYTREEQEVQITLASPEQPTSEASEMPLDQPELDSFELSEENEEEIFSQRHHRFTQDFDAAPSDSLGLVPNPVDKTKEESEKITEEESSEPFIQPDHEV